MGFLVFVGTVEAQVPNDGVYHVVYVVAPKLHVPAFNYEAPFRDTSYVAYVPKTVTAFPATANVFRRARDGLTCENYRLS